MLRFGLIGTGRIGDMHARLVALQPDAQVTWCYDLFEVSAARTAAAVGAKPTTDLDRLLGADDVDAVLIASPTNTHVEMILRSAQAGKPILCEKPIDVDIAKVEECREKLSAFDVPLQLGFNRRFDPSHAGVHKAVAAGEVGALELLVITSRDPGPPPPGPFWRPAAACSATPPSMTWTWRASSSAKTRWRCSPWPPTGSIRSSRN